MASLSAEKGPSTLLSVESSKFIVRQPAKLKELNNLLETFENLNARVGERVGEDMSGDLGGAGAGTGTSGQQGDDTAISPRDAAIMKMPTAPEILRQKLGGHIHTEMRKLEKLARRAARSSKPGAAHSLNEIYAKIRRMNALLHELLNTSIEVLKRLFIRVFIDQQPIL